eukprot:SAG31_NODE_1046_length_10177_cov_13.677218_4_plen_53_part_00
MYDFIDPLLEHDDSLSQMKTVYICMSLSLVVNSWSTRILAVHLEGAEGYASI